MSQRVTLDRQSFEQFLAATCLLLQLRQASRRHLEDSQHADEIVDDVYVPGIGVRAALGGDFAESSSFWTTVHDRSARAAQIAHHSVGVLFGGARSASLRLEGHLKNSFGKLRRRANTVAGFPSATKLGAMRLKRAIAPAPLVLRYLLRVQSLLLSALKSANLHLRELLRYRPKLPAIRLWVREIHRGQLASLSTSKTAPNRSPVKRGFKLDLKDIERFAPAWAILLIILLFVAVEEGMHKSSLTASPTGIDTAQASTLPIERISPKPHPTRSKILAASKLPAHVSTRRSANHPFQQSHLQVTDPKTDVELQDMTRYEIAKLRKDAQSGDDVSAFQVGMAYEIGYDVPQNCAEAAKWVARSAARGNAAAEYNLGLRYRDGDGVTANPAEAEKWLHQAAAQKHSAAQLALVALTAHQARRAASQP